MMKKRSIILVLLCFCFLFPNLTAYAATITGKAVHTDIVAYINGLPIPSYNIDGKTAIVAEDLEKYGFWIYYFNDERHLDIDYIDYNPQKITADYTPQKNTKPIGSFAANVYATDIVTTIGGEKVPSYNIGGRTLIFMDDLKIYGDVIWYPKERKICFTYVPNWQLSIPTDDKSNISAPIADFTIEIKKNAAGTFDFTGKNKQYLSSVSLSSGRKPLRFEFALYDLDEGIDKLYDFLKQMLNFDRDEFIKDDVTFSNQHLKVYVNGEPVAITYVTGSGGNGHSDFIFDFNKTIRNLDDIQSVQIVCK